MSELRLRKFSPIDRDYSIYEVVDEQERVLFDIGRADDGSYEVAFHEGASGRVLDLKSVEDLIAKARSLLAEEEPL